MDNELEIQEPIEPMDLSAALKAYQQQNKEMAEETVSDTEAGGGEPTQDSGELEQPVAQEAAGQPAYDGGYTDVGGSAIEHEAIDYSAWKQAEVESINQEAVRLANEKFKELGIKKFGINDLYQRNEETGEVVFTNPDNPRQPFTSRSQAQDWINSFNQQVDMEYRKLAYEKQREVYESRQPALRMIEFAPTYERMSQDEKDVFDSLIEPYAIKDSDGEPVGFSCDLNAAMVQATKIVSRFAGRTQQEQPQESQQEPQSSGPALDMKGSRTNEQPKQGEPKNLAEAMMMYNNRKGKN